MKLGYLFSIVALSCFCVVNFAGCNTTNDTDASAAHDGHDHDDHDHDHDHSDSKLPVHGPNGGHLFELAGTEMVGEWLHYNDNDIVRVILLDDKYENPVDSDGVTITPTAGDDKTPFVLELDPEKNKGDQKRVYMLEEKALNLAMTMGVEVEIKVGDKSYKGKIAAHAPHDH